MSKEIDSVSKFLSYVLRHKPSEIGLQLDSGGWASVEELIERADKAGQRLTHALIRQVVASSDKQRFRLSEDGSRIRANQGHSIVIDLGLEPVVPPDRLFHGTASRFLDVIMAEGQRPMERQYVHLSLDLGTAVAVGERHGKVVVLEVDAGAMHADGHQFFRAENGVWLCSQVPARYLRQNNYQE